MGGRELFKSLTQGAGGEMEAGLGAPTRGPAQRQSLWSSGPLL